MNLDVVSSADGASNTLLFSEKTGSQLPAVNLWNAVVPGISGSTNLLFSVSGGASTPSLFGVADSVANISGDKVVNPILSASAPLGFHSRPTANHPGGVVAAFADGHTVFLKDSIQSYVYAQLVTSDSRNASPLMNSGTTSWLYSPLTSGTYVLQDGDY